MSVATLCTARFSIEKDGHCTHKPNIEVRPYNHYYRGKFISITYSVCVFIALDIQHAKRMRRIISSSVTYSALPYRSTLSHKRHDFRGEKNYWT